ncbi:MAG: YHS domain-containing protein, partial [Candidatus Binatia bacterium]
MSIDPVCHMTVEEKTAAGSYDHRGRRYFFCSLRCLERFKQEPEKYLESASPSHQGRAGEVTPSDTLYT